MIDVRFEIQGRSFKANQFKDVVDRAVAEAVVEHIKKRVGGLRDPETGVVPRVVARGRSLDDLSFSITGSDALIKMVEERLR